MPPRRVVRNTRMNTVSAAFAGFIGSNRPLRMSRMEELVFDKTVIQIYFRLDG